MNKIKKNTFIKKIILVLFPIIIFVITYQYISTVKLYETQVIKEINTIEETVYLSEKSYETIEQIFDNKLETIMQIFEKEYEKYQNPKEIDLNDLKKSMGGDVDFYIIDNNGIIIYSTDIKDIGLDFSNFKRFHKELTQIRNTSSFISKEFEAETLSGKLRKYAYKGTKDKKYILELGLSSKIVEMYVKDLDYQIIITELKRLFPNIKDIKIYELNGDIKSVNGVNRASKEKQEIINNVIRKNTIYKKKHRNVITKIFMTNFSDKNIENKILEISYDNSYLKNEIIKRVVTILITALISFVFMIRFLNIFFGTQVKKSVDKLFWLLAILVFLDINFVENVSKFTNSMVTILLSALPITLLILYKEIKKQYGYLEKYLTHDKITKLPTRYNLEKEIAYLFMSKKDFILITLNLKNLTDILSVAGYNDFVFESISKFIINGKKNMKLFNSYTTNYEILIENNNFNLNVYIQNLLEYNKNNLLEINGNYFQLNVVIGIYCNNNSDDFKKAIKHGYEALDYACRKNKKYQTYSLEVRKYMDVIYLSSKLEECIKNNEFYIEYQPKYNIIEEKVFSCEALVRWKNREFGLIPPGEFIPYLEKTNKITLLTKWVISQVLKDIKEFDKNINLSFSINVCPIDLNSKGFVNFISDELNKFNIDSNRIELEITEGDLIKEVENSNKILSEIRKMGIKIAIDDFGTGYSSLSYLNSLPINQVKIDKSFTDTLLSEPDKKALLKYVIELCHGLKKEVIVEGVEDKETIELLKEINCKNIQGYYISKPISKEDLMIFLKNNN